MLKTKRIVITGGPGSGKTTLIEYLEQQNHSVMHEISRQVTQEAQKQGTAQLFLEKPLYFSEMLMEGRINQYHKAETFPSDFIFYDRGIGDVVAYLDYAKTDYSDDFAAPCDTLRYDRVFILPPWKAIYHSDNERYEDFDQALEIYHFLKEAYEKYGYTVYEVPTGTVPERVAYILDAIKDLH